MQNEFQIYLKGEDKTGSVQSYRRIGDKYEITFKNGRTYTYNAADVRIIESVLKNPQAYACFDYLKRIADAVGLKVEVAKGKIINILSYNYERIESSQFITPDSMLGAFLGGKLQKNNPPEPKEIMDAICPFGFNLSQKDAVDKALANRLSIIEGPPGTGKTQTILNIIANAVMRGESVAVVSGNNAATRNVFDKLRKYNVDFIAACLGNTANKIEFVNAQAPLPDITDWRLAPEVVAALSETLQMRSMALREKLARQNELATMRQELAAVQNEEQHFLQYFDKFAAHVQLPAAPNIGTSQEALDMWLLCETYPHGKGFIDFIKRLFTYLKYLMKLDKHSLLIRKLLEQHSRDYLVAALQRRFYELKISELTDSTAALVHELEVFDFDAKMREYTELSLRLFRAKLAERYTANRRDNYNISELRSKSETFIKDYPVILSTTYSLRGSLSSTVMYDYVIIDESSQVDLCTGALALSCARKAVVVGDLKQLPHVVDTKTAILTDAIFAAYGLPEAYRYKNHSMLSAVIAIFPTAPHTLLREHYRCHPRIIEFCNKKFYDGQLIVLTEPTNGREPLLVYKTTEGNHARNSINQRQIDVINNEIIPRQGLNMTDGSLGIVTPYRNQTNALQQAFAGMNVKADTVDKFQGQENEVIILSTVDNEISEFADNANRLNVAVSRASAQLIVVINDGDIRKDTNIGDLVRYIEYNNCTVADSKIHSVFDYLYKSYAQRRQALLAKRRRVSEYDSENLMYALISSVLQDNRLSGFAAAVHVPLKMIIRDTALLEPQEQQYALNILTHVDFLIFDKMGKTPRLAVEVDGAAFHATGTRQAERDAMKDAIMRKYGLPLLRLRTDGSGERRRLLDALGM